MKKTILFIVVAVVLALIALFLLGVFDGKKPAQQALMATNVPANEKQAVQKAEKLRLPVGPIDVLKADAIKYYKLVCANPDGGRMQLIVVYKDGSEKTVPAVLNLKNLSHQDVEKIKKNLTKFTSVIFKDDYVDSVSFVITDAFGRKITVQKDSVRMYRNPNGSVLITVNNIDALDWFEERMYDTLHGIRYGTGTIGPDGIKEPKPIR